MAAVHRNVPWRNRRSC